MIMHTVKPCTCLAVERKAYQKWIGLGKYNKLCSNHCEFLPTPSFVNYAILLMYSLVIFILQHCFHFCKLDEKLFYLFYPRSLCFVSASPYLSFWYLLVFAERYVLDCHISLMPLNFNCNVLLIILILPIILVWLHHCNCLLTSLKISEFKIVW